MLWNNFKSYKILMLKFLPIDVGSDPWAMLRMDTAPLT